MARALVVGAGHNGLIAAIRLARAGWSVTVAEARAEPGGLAAGGTFAGEHHHHGWLPHTAWLRPEVDGLAGLKRVDGPPLWGVRADGSSFRLDEAPGWRSWCAWADRYRPFARSLLDEPAPRLRSDGDLWAMARAAVGLRRLGERAMMELLRVGPLSAEDALSEHVQDPAVRAVAAGSALLGSFMGPLSPTGSALLLLDHALREREVDGGGPALVGGLVQAAKAAGVDLRTGQRVTVIHPRERRAAVGGEGLVWDALVATCSPKTALLELVPAQDLPVRIEYQAQEHRVRGLVAVVHLALSDGPSLDGTPVRLLHTASHPHDVERAFDAGKRGRMPVAAPVLLRVSADGRTATAWVHGVPRRPDGVEPDDARRRVLALVLEALDRVWPGCRDAITAHEVVTPDDLERNWGLPGGHLWHGEQALDQLWSLRPGLDLSGGRTPLPGVFLGGAGAAPCGGITGRPGWQVADAVGSPGGGG